MLLENGRSSWWLLGVETRIPLVPKDGALPKVKEKGSLSGQCLFFPTYMYCLTD
jgi:hypothetical protein